MVGAVLIKLSEGRHPRSRQFQLSWPEAGDGLISSCLGQRGLGFLVRFSAIFLPFHMT